jgi:uncharacterized protein (DUF1330 family)
MSMARLWRDQGKVQQARELLAPVYGWFRAQPRVPTNWRKNMQAKYIVAMAIGSFALGIGTNSVLHAQAKPPLYTIAEINVKDRSAYEKELPAVLTVIKDGGGVYLAGGFDKAKLDYGSPPVANRYVLIRYDSADAYAKAWNGGIKKWVDDVADKKIADFRLISVEGVEQK